MPRTPRAFILYGILIKPWAYPDREGGGGGGGGRGSGLPLENHKWLYKGSVFKCSGTDLPLEAIGRPIASSGRSVRPSVKLLMTKKNNLSGTPMTDFLDPSMVLLSIPKTHV